MQSISESSKIRTISVDLIDHDLNIRELDINPK